MHPYHPLLYVFLRFDERFFLQIEKIAKIPWKCSHIHKKVTQTISFSQIRKLHDILRFNVKSKRQKLRHQGCASYVDNSMQIPEPT